MNMLRGLVLPVLLAVGVFSLGKADEWVCSYSACQRVFQAFVDLREEAPNVVPPTVDSSDPNEVREFMKGQFGFDWFDDEDMKRRMALITGAASTNDIADALGFPRGTFKTVWQVAVNIYDYAKTEGLEKAMEDVEPNSKSFYQKLFALFDILKEIGVLDIRIGE